MDPAILSATSALVGSLVGGAATLTASWLTQRGQLRAQALVHEAVKREALYAEFIVEASRRLTDAWVHHAETPEVLAVLYSAMQRMRLTSSTEIIDAAQNVLRYVVDAYAAPDRSFEELRQRLQNEDDRDLLRTFAEVCRVELQALLSLSG
jgi:hypothetical protein